MQPRGILCALLILHSIDAHHVTARIHGEGDPVASARRSAAAVPAAPPLLPRERPVLRFTPNGTFRIALFTDLHLGEADELDARTLKLVSAVLEAERPQLVVLGGDTISGGFWDRRPGWFKSKWEPLKRLLAAANTPHAAALGNHCAEADLSRRAAAEAFSDAPLALARVGPRGLGGGGGRGSGSVAGNYWVDILPSFAVSGGKGDNEGSPAATPAEAGAAAEEAAAAARVWVLDSGRRTCEGVRGWGCVPKGALQWARQAASALPPAPGVAFVHIPAPEFLELWKAPSATVRGSKAEGVGCPTVTTSSSSSSSSSNGGFGSGSGSGGSLVSALRDLGVSALYSGHDHSNDFEGEMDGFRLGYGRKSGAGSYGPPPGWRIGARIIQLREGRPASEAETWLRLEGGGKDVQQGADRKGVDPGETCDPGRDGWEIAGDALYITPAAAAAAVTAAVMWRRLRGRSSAAAKLSSGGSRAALPQRGRRRGGGGGGSNGGGGDSGRTSPVDSGHAAAPLSSGR